MQRSTQTAPETRSGFLSGRFVLLVLPFALLASGCDLVRGWLALARGDRQEPSSSVSAGLGAYDCPPGLARCLEGRVEKSIGGSIDGLTLERKGCPFEWVDTCEARCLDDEDHLEEELPELCVGDATYRLRHPRIAYVQDASIDDATRDATRDAIDAAIDAANEPLADSRP